jgi:hypothetical protein
MMSKFLHVASALPIVVLLLSGCTDDPEEITSIASSDTLILTSAIADTSTITLTNDGDKAYDWQAELVSNAAQPLLTFSPASGNLPAGQTANITVIFQPVYGIAPGTINNTLKITYDTDKTMNIALNRTVQEDWSPLAIGNSWRIMSHYEASYEGETDEYDDEYTEIIKHRYDLSALGFPDPHFGIDAIYDDSTEAESNLNGVFYRKDASGIWATTPPMSIDDDDYTPNTFVLIPTNPNTKIGQVDVIYDTSISMEYEGETVSFESKVTREVKNVGAFTSEYLNFPSVVTIELIYNQTASMGEESYEMISNNTFKFANNVGRVYFHQEAYEFADEPPQITEEFTKSYFVQPSGSNDGTLEVYVPEDEEYPEDGRLFIPLFKTFYKGLK